MVTKLNRVPDQESHARVSIRSQKVTRWLLSVMNDPIRERKFPSAASEPFGNKV
jgi:hypothetical protein